MQAVNFLADLILVLHLLLALFIVGGLLLTWIGPRQRWRWVKNYWFRSAHLFAIIFVAAETLLGVVCPLTTLEDMLRGNNTSAQGFIERWVGRVLFYDLPVWIFNLGYLTFAALTIHAWRRVPPQKRA